MRLGIVLKGKIVLSEQQECELFFEWAETYPATKSLLIKFPNEGKRSISFMRSLLRIGFRKGIPDYVLPIPSGDYGSLWIEMKRRKDYHVSREQRAWIDKLRLAGNYATIALGWEHARQITLDYLDGRIKE